MFAVCLLCFRRQAQILRRRYSSRSVQRLHSNRSTRSRRSIGQIDRNVFCFFMSTPQFFPDSAAVCRNAGASPDVVQRSNCQGVPRRRRGSMRSMNRRGIVWKSKHPRRSTLIYRRHLRANARVSIAHMWVSICAHQDQDTDVIIITYVHVLPHLS